MIEQPIPGGGFSCRVDPGQLGAFSVLAQGPGVLLLEPNAGASPPDPDAVTPDPLAFLAALVADGFFVPAATSGPEPALSITAARAAPEEQMQQWQLAARNLGPGLLRVLANLVVARQMERIEIAAAGPPLPELDATALPYAGLAAAPRFAVDHVTPGQPHRARCIELTFSQPPDEAATETAFAILDDWLKLLLLGAYPRPGVSPIDAGLIPDIAQLVEPQMILQPIEVAFACDEAAFTPLITCLHTGKGRDLPLAAITIR